MAQWENKDKDAHAASAAEKETLILLAKRQQL